MHQDETIFFVLVQPSMLRQRVTWLNTTGCRMMYYNNTWRRTLLMTDVLFFVVGGECGLGQSLNDGNCAAQRKKTTGKPKTRAASKL